MFGKTILLMVGYSTLALACTEPSRTSGDDDNLDQAVQAVSAPYSQVILQTGTGLGQTEDSNGDFRLADVDLDGRLDLVYVKRRGTGTGTVEVHVLSAASGFQHFIVQTDTGLSATEDNSGDFLIADLDRDGRPDLVFIKRRSTASGTIEVHALSGASGFRQFIVDTATAFSAAENAFGDFSLADVDRDGRPDLVYIKRQQTGTGTIEVHVLSGASGFQQIILQTGTALAATAGAFGDLSLVDVDRDGALDLVLIKRRKTATGAIEVHVLSAASGFQQFIQHLPSAFSVVDDGSGDFSLIDVNGDGQPDLVFVKRRNTGTNTIELHALAG
jgi:hypothetical protein